MTENFPGFVRNELSIDIRTTLLTITKSMSPNKHRQAYFEPHCRMFRMFNIANRFGYLTRTTS